MKNIHDQMEIRELLHSYLAYVDLRDNEGYVNTFAKNGVYESPFGIASGHEEIHKKLKRWHGSGITNNKRHFAGTVISKIDENWETATSDSNFWVAETTDSATIVCTGYYEDKLIKE
ncbi:nuclear transport factor 2 family protein, partial [Xanthovirga aplysinae]|uniref:nuclear transport factor 2 family protein n=1 Tax=Xanthovirga aplysinae TaxID=2529853 RepID=UPI0016570942